MLVEVWRIHQPDCPVVSVSERFPEERFDALSSRLVRGKVYGYLYVGNSPSLRSILDSLRGDERVEEVRVVSKRGSRALLSIRMHSTMVMDALTSEEDIFWHSPLFASNGYEYWVVVVMRGVTKRLRENLAEKGHEVSIVRSMRLNASTFSAAKLVLDAVGIREYLEKRLSNGCTYKDLRLFAGGTLGEVAALTGQARSYLSVRRRRALATCAELVAFLEGIFKDFG